jgi:hypothetical protein
MEGDEARLMDTMCQSISKGSYSLLATLRHVKPQSNIKEGEDKREAAYNAISTVRLALSICNVIGQTFWRIFMALRSDVNTVAHYYVKRYKSKK